MVLFQVEHPLFRLIAVMNLRIYKSLKNLSNSLIMKCTTNKKSHNFPLPCILLFLMFNPLIVELMC